MIKLGIVVGLYNSNRILEAFIKSISQQDYSNYLLILVDNSASTETDKVLQDVLSKYPIPHYIHIKNETNLGASGANNLGIKRAFELGCDAILLTNVDVSYPNTQIFSKAIELFSTTNEKIIAPKMYCADGKTLWWAGGSINRLLAKVRHFGYMQNENNQYNVPKKVQYSPTTFMFIKKEVFDEVGLFDKKYFVYFEDFDWIYRCAEKGISPYYYPDININHLVSYSTGGSYSYTSLYFGTRNRLYFAIKNLPFYKWFVTIPYILLITFSRMFTFNYTQNKAIIKGVIDVVRMF